MRLRRALAATTAVAACVTLPLAAGAQPAAAQAGPAALPSTVSAAPLRTGTTFLVNTAPGPAGAATARAAIRAAGGVVLTAWPEIGVTVGAGVNLPATSRAVARIRARQGILSVGVSGVLEPDQARQRHVAAARSRLKETPGAIALGASAPRANAIATGRGVSIGVADTGVLEEDSELAGRVDTRRSGTCVGGGVFRTGPATWRPAGTGGFLTHGTEVAGVAAAAADGVGMRGVAPQATVVALRVVSDDGNIYPEASICAAMTAAAEHLPVLNHSYGIDSARPLRDALWDPANRDDAAVITAVTRAFMWSRAHGVLNVAATGNSGEDLSDKPHIPLAASEQRLGPIPARLKALLAEVPGVVGVGESEPDRTVTFWSSVGLGVVDIAAVGSGLLPVSPNVYDTDAGTSFSAPAVAATAALVKQVRPNAGPGDLERIVLGSASPRSCVKAGGLVSEQPCRARGGLTSYFGHGILDAYAAVRAARAGR